ncbi:MAG: bifunctional 2-C-methyl-D-erythritol 4-phosphate cytidylyltransferase/2-C-methyl-D-erythritol 2,4-cyclodiphosphate synthase [Caulobacteraceae bacterium]
MDCCAVIVAGGLGVRAGAGEAKQWRRLAGRPVVRWSVEALLGAGAAPLIVVIPAGGEVLVAEALEGLIGWRAVVGGPTRTRSVRHGLAALDTAADRVVLVHDAARPFVGSRHVEALIAAMEGADGAIPSLAVADTLKRSARGEPLATIDRAGLWRAQTPQAFRLGVLRAAYEAWPTAEEASDDAAAVERAGGRVALAAGDPMLMKLTYPEDFAMAERLAGTTRTTVIGHGFDVHAFGPGEAVWLCGVRIEHTASLVGHSDADAGLHAITDAILGAIGAGDIGEHFPPSDPRWKDASSAIFLEHALAMTAARGGRVANVDVTLICEAPKIRPHRDAMRARLAQLLGISSQRINVKATTTEGLGFTGRSEGLAAQAVASVEIPA